MRLPFILGSVFSILFHSLSWTNTLPFRLVFFLSSKVSLLGKNGCVSLHSPWGLLSVLPHDSHPELHPALHSLLLILMSCCSFASFFFPLSFDPSQPCHLSHRWLEAYGVLKILYWRIHGKHIQITTLGWGNILSHWDSPQVWSAG